MLVIKMVEKIYKVQKNKEPWPNMIYSERSIIGFKVD